jgi:cobalt-zinc-cadmium efflux system membrane fusion protein
MIYRFLLILSVILAAAIGLQAQDHDDHDHDREATTQPHADDHGDEHEQDATDEHDHDAHEDHGEFSVTLSRDAVALAGIKTATVVRGRISNTIELPGEVGFDENKLAHISPRFPGIAQRANYNVGEYVEAGQVMAVVESNESMNPYEIKAPISGWVIEKHITPGEFVSGENSIFVLADLSTVWINLAVYPRDINRVRKGQTAHLKAIGSEETTTGTIDYITPLVDLRTRSATARVTLSNDRNEWRPGTFVQATITTPGKDTTLIVEKDAVQYLDERSVVFVSSEPNVFQPVDVVIGDSDANYVQILGGLTESATYVSKGAFELKAKIVTSNMDAHAGHGH